jgi:hypothetical protein
MICDSLTVNSVCPKYRNDWEYTEQLGDPNEELASYDLVLEVPRKSNYNL